MLMYRDAGGGGDCMFHSIASCMGGGKYTNLSLRAAAAAAVTPENAPDLLMDMAAQVPSSISTLMDVPAGAGMGGQFSPELLWNSSKGSKEMMAAGLASSVVVSGNHMWGDATLAALLENVLDVNIMLLAVDTGTAVPLTSKEMTLARAIFGRWVERSLEIDPRLLSASKEDVLKLMMSCNLTWDRALKLARMETGSDKNKWLRGRRQPVGTVRTLLTNPDAGNISLNGYSPNRPTIIIWNRSNAHWVPVGVGPFAETLITPQSELRKYIEDLMK